MGGNQLIGVVEGIEVEKLIFTGIDLAALVEFAAADTHVVVLYGYSHLDKFVRIELQPIHSTERAKERKRHSCRRRQSAYGQRALDDATQTARQRIAASQFQRSSTQIVSPIALPALGHLRHVPLRTLVELQRAELNDAVLLRTIGHVDTLVDSLSRNLAHIMIGVRPDGANAVGTEHLCRCISVIYLVKSSFAVHHTPLY